LEGKARFPGKASKRLESEKAIDKVLDEVPSQKKQGFHDDNVDLRHFFYQNQESIKGKYSSAEILQQTTDLLLTGWSSSAYESGWKHWLC